jgi:L-ascorbate 6-phosphate lactonase
MNTPENNAILRQMATLSVPPGSLAVWGLGQMGIALKGSGSGILYIDPILSNVVAETFPAVADKFNRAFPPPLLPAEITNASLVLCTHEHLDHTDPLTLTPFSQASPQAKFVISGWAAGMLAEMGIANERILIPEAGKPLQLGEVRITAIPAAHYAVEHDPDKGYRWLSYLVEMNGVTLFHSGDTLLYPGYLETLRQLPQIDIAVLAVNGRDAYRESFDVLGNLLPAEAAWLAKELKVDLLIAGHNDLFTWNTIHPGELADALAQHNPEQKYKVLRPGELCFYSSSFPV